MLPPRSWLAFGLALAPFSFFLNPAGWVWLLLILPDDAPKRPPASARS